MNFMSQRRYTPKTRREERYYRLKESHRNALGRSCTCILLNVGFIDDLQPEEMRDISRALTYKYGSLTGKGCGLPPVEDKL